MDNSFEMLSRELDSIAIFRNVLKDPVLVKMRALIGAPTGDPRKLIRRYSAFVAELYKHTVNFSEYVLRTVFEDENIFIIQSAKGENIDPYILEAAENELLILQRFSQLSPSDFNDETGIGVDLPKWRTCQIDFLAEYLWRRTNADKFGYGKYARSNMFTLRDGQVVPVDHPDPQRLSELFGYERQRREVIDNTLALVNGKPAQNVLLYGDAGTGKSSTVKAVVNEFSDRGLRLIEISKEQLRELPVIIGEISQYPLKFIIFIDDLSFTSGEDSFGALKAALEGSASARGENMVIYATSNRRHLIRESFSDREGDDIHRNDTMQENLSLSARFGLRVSFGRPDKKEFIAIAEGIAKEKGLELPEDLGLKAEQFVMSSGNGRSPRTAKQFVELLLSR
ncbi:MAG TPA: ATP-binding protein [Ruminococcus sp.]|nr:ATP-binding protein [Ruminococcus sp.]